MDVNGAKGPRRRAVPPYPTHRRRRRSLSSPSLAFGDQKGCPSARCKNLAGARASPASPSDRTPGPAPFGDGHHPQAGYLGSECAHAAPAGGARTGLPQRLPGPSAQPLFRGVLRKVETAEISTLLAFFGGTRKPKRLIIPRVVRQCDCAGRHMKGRHPAAARGLVTRPAPRRLPNVHRSVVWK